MVDKSASAKAVEDEAAAKIMEEYFLRPPAASTESVGDKYFEEPPSSTILTAAKS